MLKVTSAASSAADVNKALIVHRGTAIRGGESAGGAGIQCVSDETMASFRGVL